MDKKVIEKRNKRLLARYEQGETLGVLARRFKISRQRISHILKEAGKNPASRMEQRLSERREKAIELLRLSPERPNSEIGQEAGISPELAGQLRRELGMPDWRSANKELHRLRLKEAFKDRSAEQRKKKKLPPIDKDAMVKDYVDGEMSIREVAGKHKVAVMTVHRALVEKRIDRRIARRLPRRKPEADAPDI